MRWMRSWAASARSRCTISNPTRDAFRTVAVMIREPEKKKEQEKRRPSGKLSPWS
jgi:hypothetical protein